MSLPGSNIYMEYYVSMSYETKENRWLYLFDHRQPYGQIEAFVSVNDSFSLLEFG